MTSAAPIRVARPEDATAFLALRALMFEAMGTPAASVADPRWRAEGHRWFRESVDRPSVRIVVAEVDARVVSCAAGEVGTLAPGPSVPNGSVGLLFNVATLPAYRGRGLARECTDAVLDWFRDDTDVTRVDLFATPEGSGIYRARGFLEVPQPAMRWRLDRT